VLVVAGRDPTGGAGVDADREALSAFGCEAATVLTALTDQDGERFYALGARDPRAWLAEARAELHDAPAALKTGLLPGAAHVAAAARLAGELAPGTPVVVDPVLAASGGEVLLDDAGILVLLAELVPCGVVLTPNVPEAARLTDLDPERLAAEPELRLAAARRLCAAGARAVVLKGGHDAVDPVRDLVLERDGEPVWLLHPRVRGMRLHGSGCRFASALAAGLAAGVPLPEAAGRAGEWVARLVRERGHPLGGQRPPR
jgi:hydroxymethylpyrimidine/phosphomethylpyrimidine kinase